MLSRKYVKRVVGEPKDLPPPIAKKLENRARRWMVAIEWLNKPENKDYDTPSRIAASGVAWGDEKDPEEIEAIQKRVKEEKEDIKRKKVKEEVEGGGKRQKANKGKRKRYPSNQYHLPQVSTNSMTWPTYMIRTEGS